MRWLSGFACLLFPFVAMGQEKPILPDWDYITPMKKVAAKFNGRAGVVLHIGDSITYSNPYGQWARSGEGQSAADKAVLQWMHSGKDNDRDGWHLARFDHPDGGRSYTACSGLRLDELLVGGKQKMPSLANLLETYKPQAVVLMIGTNDATGSRRPKDFLADYAKAIDTITGQGVVPIVSTIPPHVNNFVTAQEFNEGIRALAKERGLPLIDYEKEILTRRPKDWNGTLMQRGDVHPTAGTGGTKANSAPTAENLKNSGYLLRGWLSVQMIGHVKSRILDDAYKPAPPPKPTGKPVKVPITRDTWLSNVGDEANTTNGGSPRLKLKSYQELSLFDIDTTPLKGHIITGATLHVKLAGPERLHRVTVGTVGAEWVEGKGASYAKENGASTFAHRLHPDTPWTIVGSDLCSVILGQGGTVWGFGDASDPDDGWQTIPVDPHVMQTRVAGAGFGFVLFDDTGSEWSRNGEAFTWRHFPNRFIFSREQRANAPYLTVYLGEADTTPPEAITEVTPVNAELPAGEALVQWPIPMDRGSGVRAFNVTIDGKTVPRYLIPAAKGDRVTMHVRDLNLPTGGQVRLGLSAIDGAGNVGPERTFKVTLSGIVPKELPAHEPAIPNATGELPTLGKATVAIVDELDVVDPLTGSLTPTQNDNYLKANHLWNIKDGLRLWSAKNEFLALQVLLNGEIHGLQASLTFPQQPKISTTFGTYQLVTTKNGQRGDPITPLDDRFKVPTVDGQRVGSLHVEMFVPAETPAGVQRGVLKLQSGTATLELPVTLTVWDFTLPNHLSFLPDMNGYGLPASERGYYRLAHRHRTVLNIVPYSQRGQVSDGYAPRWDGQTLDFTAWDRRFGPYFDGSAFSDLPRKNVPLECFYLPMHENWPSPINDHYNGDYWADRAFTPAYRANFVRVAKQFAEHINERKWNDTLFQGFLNNKVDYKRNGWSRGSSPWLLDEPQSFQDFWALRYFANAFHEGVRSVAGQAKVVFRSDISRPMWQRDSLDGLNDYNVVNNDFRRYHRIVMDRKRAFNELVIEYGSANDVGRSNLQGVAWSIDAWGLGADGVLPWLTVGTAKAWTNAEATSLFYPPLGVASEPTPSVRLKAYRRGQQDVEYLTLYTLATQQPRWAVGQQIRTALKLTGKREGTGVAGEDAGVLSYDQLKPQALWAMRVRIGEALSALRPTPKDRLVELAPKRAVSSPK